MSAEATDAAHTVASRVSERIDRIFASVDEQGRAIARWLETNPSPSVAELDRVVGDLVIEHLQPTSLVTGAGFVVTPGLLRDAHWHLAWWLGGHTALRRLTTSDDPESEDFRDYTALEWFRYPERTGSRHLTGPYVDYLCTDDYTITVTAPVMVAGRMAGVVGADALVDRLEDVLLPELRLMAGRATLVAASGRVLVATDARMQPGSMLRVGGLGDALLPLRAAGSAGVDHLLPDGGRVVSCGATSLALVIET